MMLRQMAHARTGDKGAVVTISLIAYRTEDFERMARTVTAERVSALFGGLIEGPAIRYEMPHLGALNFVLRRPETCGVTRSLALDAHGKCLGSALLGMEI